MNEGTKILNKLCRKATLISDKDYESLLTQVKSVDPIKVII